MQSMENVGKMATRKSTLPEMLNATVHLSQGKSCNVVHTPTHYNPAVFNSVIVKVTVSLNLDITKAYFYSLILHVCRIQIFSAFTYTT